MKSILKSVSVFALLGSVAACGTETSVISIQDRVDQLFKDDVLDVRAFDSSGDGNLQIGELKALWEHLPQEEKEMVAASFGYTIEEANELAELYEGNDDISIVAGLNKVNNDINLGFAHANGITGEGIDILVLDDFRSYGLHGTQVANVIDSVAPGANVIKENIADTYTDDEGVTHTYFSDGTVDFQSQTNKEAEIINMSYEGYMADRPEETQIALDEYGLNNNMSLDELKSALVAIDGEQEARTDALVVVAAGNRGEDGLNCQTFDKCNVVALDSQLYGETLIVVGALNDQGTALESYSTEAGILQDYFISSPVSNANGDIDGTSFAAPYVAGTAALIMQKFGSDAQTTQEIIFDTADDLGAVGTDSVYGRGALNVGRAISPVGHLK